MEVKRFILSDKKQIIDTAKEKDYIVNKTGELAKVVVNGNKKKIVLAGKMVKTGDELFDLLEDEDVIKSDIDNFMYYVWQYKMSKGDLKKEDVALAYKVLKDERLILFYKKGEEDERENTNNSEKVVAGI